jgi:hypothetical protein
MHTKVRPRIAGRVGAGSDREGGSRRENCDGFIHKRWDLAYLLRRCSSGELLGCRGRLRRLGSLLRKQATAVS